MSREPRQKFHRGDRVHIGAMPPEMSHFPANVDAIIGHSYKELFGGELNPEHKYEVYILPEGHFCAWYGESQLTKIKGPHGARMAERFAVAGR